MEINGFQINAPKVRTQEKPGQSGLMGRKETTPEESGRIQQDTLTVSGGSLSDKQFINVVRKRLLSEVCRETPEYKINSLRDQVAAGEYEINATEVARKMMLESER